MWHSDFSAGGGVLSYCVGTPPPFPPEAQGHCQQSREGHRDPTTLALSQLRPSGLPAVQGQPRTVRARACPSCVVAASANPHGRKPRGGGPPPAPPPAPSGGVRGPLPEQRQTGRPVQFHFPAGLLPTAQSLGPPRAHAVTPSSTTADEVQPQGGSAQQLRAQARGGSRALCMRPALPLRSVAVVQGSLLPCASFARVFC